MRVLRVLYKPRRKTAEHDHPATPTSYVYLTHGGRLKISRGDETRESVRWCTPVASVFRRACSSGI